MTGAGAATAQVPPGAIVQPLGPDRGAELRSYLTTLADNPQNLDALIGAGRAALDMGDTDAALNFFGRADQIAPRDARVKAGIASTLVELGQAQPALRTFGEAVALGAPEAEIAADRGLAHDMVGDPRRAQQDYLIALRHREDAEVRRRLALSLAISGQREAALRLIDAQLRANDRAGWRTQAFILALTGDAAGANRTALSVMPPGSARDMAPFFARLHGLSPAQKAMAVHLGRFPSDGQPRTQVAHVDVSPDPAAVALALGRPAATATHQPTATTRASTTSRHRSGRESRASREAETRVREARRRPEPVFDSADPYGLRQPAVATTRREAPPQPPAAPAQAEAPATRQTEIAELNTRWAGAPYSGAQVQSPAEPPIQPAPPPPPAQLPAAPQVQAPAEPLSSAVAPPLPVSPPPSANGPAAPAVREVEIPAASLGAPVTTPLDPAAAAAGEVAAATEASPAESAPEPDKNSPSPQSETPGLADIAAVVNALPQESRAAPAAPPQATRAARTRTVEARTPRTRTPPPNPARHWVQIATGPDRSLLPREYARLRALAPEQFGRRSAYTTPLRATNRLLVGPFATAQEAQELVNQLAHRNVSAFAWTSAAGQEIDRIQTR